MKARVLEWGPIEDVLSEIGAREAGQFAQRDVFFRCRRGRLKLRLVAGRPAQLIGYERKDAACVRASEYQVVEVEDGGSLLRVLELALGRLGEVRKRRRLFLLDNVRIHLDEVDRLGRFLEIEAVVGDRHPEPECHALARALLARLGVRADQVQERAYVDLLAEGFGDGSRARRGVPGARSVRPDREGRRSDGPAAQTSRPAECACVFPRAASSSRRPESPGRGTRARRPGRGR
ncbi:MAG: class IV adenylate cyclase [Candidatus Krumholzibacteriia bacterium]